ncbi:hypothetical protein HMPREF1986_01337 [Oribacterium sp. oral taxon 078 str. F0263]|nr:hypothetical protein HMPREF1986_01337 [Oribacterium sp. oral taxon 078 str. F0263]
MLPALASAFGSHGLNARPSAFSGSKKGSRYKTDCLGSSGSAEGAEEAISGQLAFKRALSERKAPFIALRMWISARNACAIRRFVL